VPREDDCREVDPPWVAVRGGHLTVAPRDGSRMEHQTSMRGVGRVAACQASVWLQCARSGEHGFGRARGDKKKHFR
jgi:hypothetical protein